MLHGRRKGKKLRSRQAGLVKDLLPRLQLDLNSVIAHPAELFAPVAREVWLEIGFGGGEHLFRQAAAHPDIGFLGCEPFVNGAAKLLAAVAEAGLVNIRLHVGDAGEIVDRLPDASISRIFLLYPDPWPKRRQRKRRLVSDGMLARLARVLRAGGHLRFATDIDDYAGWTLARIRRSADFSWQPRVSADWLSPWDGWTATRYEEKAVREWRASCYLTFVRRG